MSHNSAFSDVYPSSIFKNSSLLLTLGNRTKLLNITLLSLFITTTRHDNYRYKPHSETFVIKITNFPLFRKTIDVPAKVSGPFIKPWERL
jgi:hypothetical protein